MNAQLLVEKPERASSVHSKAQLNRLGGRALVIGILAAVILVGSLVATMIVRHRERSALDAAAAASEPPTVAVATARLAPAASELNLPGNALALREAGLYPRTTGYITRWLADRDDHVKKGQLLAEISAPDVDDQLAQARANLVLAKANLEVAEANLALAKITLTRDVNGGLATAQLTLDQDRAQVTTTQAQVASAKASIEVNQATIQQYLDLQSFQKIVAPFDGVITGRRGSRCWSRPTTPVRRARSSTSCRPTRCGSSSTSPRFTRRWSPPARKPSSTGSKSRSSCSRAR